MTEQQAEQLMRDYLRHWENADAEGILAMYHLPYLSLRNGLVTVYPDMDAMREVTTRLLGYWKRDRVDPNAFDAIPPLRQNAGTVIVRVQMGEWTLYMPDRPPLKSPTYYYVVTEKDGVTKVSQVISDW